MSGGRGDAHRAAEAIWRLEAPRVIAGLARITGDIGMAEDFAQDALVIALEQWPRDGVPPNPGGWLMSTAKHRAIDALRRQAVYQRKLAEIGRDLADSPGSDQDAGLDQPINDDLLRLIFMACHPVLPPPARVALALRLLGGLSAAEIARAFLVPEPTVAQRIVRAKRTLAERGIRFELPAAADLPDRLSSVLEVIYLIFNEGYSAASGADWTRPDLCHEAQRLGRVLAGLMPGQPEAHGLTALMELQASRLRARTAPGGDPVLLGDQDRRLWDRLLIRRGLAALERADAAGGRFGPYALQAAIAACHVTAASAAATDWGRIVALYTVLGHVAPSPVAELNRAVAVGRARSPEAGLAILDALAAAGTLGGYPYLPAARADLLARLGRADEARLEFSRAAALTANASERALYQRQAAAAGS